MDPQSYVCPFRSQCHISCEASFLLVLLASFHLIVGAMEGYVLWGQQEGSLMGGLPGKLQTSSSHGKPVCLGRHWPWQLTLEGAGRLGRSHKLFQTTKTWKPVWQQLWRYDYALKRHFCSKVGPPQTNNSCTMCTCSAHSINICTTPSFEIRHYIHENLLKAHLNHQKYLPGENEYHMIDSVGYWGAFKILQHLPRAMWPLLPGNGVNY